MSDLATALETEVMAARKSVVPQLEFACLRWRRRGLGAGLRASISFAMCSTADPTGQQQSPGTWECEMQKYLERSRY